MICRKELAAGKVLIIEGNVRIPEGETFIGEDMAGREHVLRVIEQRFKDYQWYWCYEHICRVIDDEFERMYLEEDDYVQ